MRMIVMRPKTLNIVVAMRGAEVEAEAVANLVDTDVIIVSTDVHQKML